MQLQGFLVGKAGKLIEFIEFVEFVEFVEYVDSWFLFTREKEDPRINTNLHE